MAQHNIDYAPTAALTSAPQGFAQATRRRWRSAAQVDVGSIIGGRYQLVRFVAEGAFGAVYQAHDLEVSGHVVALKLMHSAPESEQERQQQLREVQLIAAIAHPSVVSFKDHGLHRERPYIVMPWYEGETLAQRLERGALTRHEARRIFAQLAQALAVIHERGIRHQDVKPENILLARFGAGQEAFPVLLDLGVAAFQDEFMPAFTPAYAAPEMARAHLEVTEGRPATVVDDRADVFALALTLFDALAPGARELPSYDGSLRTLSQRLREGVRLPHREELTDLMPAFLRWLSPEPARRPSAAQFARELELLTRAEERRVQRCREARRIGPLLSAALAMSLLLGFELHNARAQHTRSDAQLDSGAQYCSP